MTASLRFENCIKYCMWALIEPPTATWREEVGPILSRPVRAVRAEIVHRTRISYHVAEDREEEST